MQTVNYAAKVLHSSTAVRKCGCLSHFFLKGVEEHGSVLAVKLQQLPITSGKSMLNMKKYETMLCIGLS